MSPRLLCKMTIAILALLTPAGMAMDAGVPAAKGGDMAVSLLPGSAKLQVSVDVRALDGNKDLQPLWKKVLELPQIQEGLSKVQEAFAFDLRRDLNRVTFGVDPKRKGSEFIVLEGRLDTGKIQETFLMMGAEPDVYNGSTIYRTKDEKEPGVARHFSILKPDLLVFGQKDAVMGAVDRLREKAGGAAAAPDGTAAKGPVIRATLKDIAGIPAKKNPIQPVLDSLEATLDAGDAMALRVQLRCKDATAAKRMRAIAEGGAALLLLVLAENPELEKLLAGVLDSAKFTQEGASVLGEVKMPPAEAVNALLKAVDMAEQRRRLAPDPQVGAVKEGEF